MESYTKQKIRIHQYMEELYIRHSSYSLCEADDCISYYCSESKNEEIIILTSDRDLLQLISPNVSTHIISLNKIFRYGDKVPLDGVYIPHNNVRVVKTICGDASDNIYGIKMVGIKSLVKINPDIIDKDITLEQVFQSINNKKKTTRKEKNILEGITNKGTYGVEILEKNFNIIGTGEKFLTLEAIEGIKELQREAIDPEGRHWKNALDLMMSDGILNILPKKDDAWVDFVRPFLRLTRIEKDFYKNKKDE